MGLTTPVASAQVPDGKDGGGAIQSPTWAAVPGGDALAPFFPDRAQRMEVSGRARIKCLATADGLLSACEVIEEFPAGYGFGAATLKVSRFFRLKPTDRDGSSVGGRTVIIPLRWKLAQPGPGEGATFLAPAKHMLTWATAPSQAQMDAAYPTTAKGLGIAGYHCVATASGALTSCSVAFESPTGMDFGPAGLRLMPLFRAGPRWDGAPLEGSQVEVPLHFYPPTDVQWGDAGSSAPTAGPTPTR